MLKPHINLGKIKLALYVYSEKGNFGVLLIQLHHMFGLTIFSIGPVNCFIYSFGSDNSVNTRPMVPVLPNTKLFGN